MKVINIMNFVRQIDERMEDSLNVLYNTTTAGTTVYLNIEFSKEALSEAESARYYRKPKIFWRKKNRVYDRHK